MGDKKILVIMDDKKILKSVRIRLEKLAQRMQAVSSDRGDDSDLEWLTKRLLDTITFIQMEQRLVTETETQERADRMAKRLRKPKS